MNQEEQTLYEVLGVQQDATLEEIKDAYRQRALECHPDVNPESNSQESHEKMCQINEAYSVLRNSELRMVYDELLQKIGKYEVELDSTDYDSKNDYRAENNSQDDRYDSEKHAKKKERYNYYNYCDYDEYEQEEFIIWLEDFIDSYISKISGIIKEHNYDRIYKGFNKVIIEEKPKNNKKKNNKCK